MAETRASTREAFLTTGPVKEAAISLRRRGRLVGKSKVPQIPLLPWAREHKTPHSPTKPSPSSPPSKAIKLKRVIFANELLPHNADTRLHCAHE